MPGFMLDMELFFFTFMKLSKQCLARGHSRYAWPL